MLQNKPFTDEHLYGIALGLLPNIGNALAGKLIFHFGNARQVFKTPRRILRKLIPPGILSKLNFNDAAILNKAQAEVDFCIRNDISVILCNDDDFPRRLLLCADGPYLLFSRGEACLNAGRMLAIVGTRKGTNYSQRFIDRLVEELASDDITVVSGLARGVDGFAHQACLKHQVSTIGVIGHGHRFMSPVAHRSMARQMIAQGGGILTEYLYDSPANKYSFPARNRIIAGMSDAVLVVESAIKGGALITADIAQSYNRDVFAVPGKTTDRFSAGCNCIIKEQKAVLVESAADILSQMNWERITACNSKPSIQKSLFPELTENELSVMRFLQHSNRRVHIDEIREGSDLSPGGLGRCLLSLELKGMLHSAPGNRYELS